MVSFHKGYYYFFFVIVPAIYMKNHTKKFTLFFYIFLFCLLHVPQVRTGKEDARHTRVIKHWSWRRSSTSTATFHGDGVLRLHMLFAWRNVRSKSGFKTEGWNGKKRTNLRVPALLLATKSGAMTRMSRLGTL